MYFRVVFSFSGGVCSTIKQPSRPNASSNLVDTICSNERKLLTILVSSFFQTGSKQNQLPCTIRWNTPCNQISFCQSSRCSITILSSVISSTAYFGPSLPIPLLFSPPYGMRSARHCVPQFTIRLPESTSRANFIAQSMF